MSLIYRDIQCDLADSVLEDLTSSNRQNRARLSTETACGVFRNNAALSRRSEMRTAPTDTNPMVTPTQKIGYAIRH